MRRYASIDFLRGLAIFLMLFLHIINDILDQTTLLANPNDIPAINIVALVVLPFLGGLAGFFLMVSAIGNMISMMRFLQKGKPVKDLIIRQVMGGVLLLIFAMLSEGVIGYHGAVGNIFKTLDDLSAWNWTPIFYRGFHFETIHTIAWCIILNGIVQGILVKVHGIENYKKIIKSYIVLAIIIVAITPFVWDALFQALGNSYPFGTNPAWNQQWHTPDLRYASFADIVVIFFANVVAGRPEPVLPYLAVSFIGSIIGILLAQPKDKIPRTFPKKLLIIAFIMFIIGLIGLVGNVIAIMEYDADAALNLYTYIWDHRIWVNSALNAHNIDFSAVPSYLPVVGWLFQFLVLNGVGLAAIVLIIRLVEFRGNGKPFAKHTTFIRRFGFIAFTIYNIQFIYYVAHFFISGVFYGDPYVHLDWGGTFITMLLAFAMFYAIMKLWEKVNYIGSIEWMIGTIAAYLIPGRKRSIVIPWYRRGELNVEGAFYNAEWLNVVEKDEINHEQLAESKLAWYLSGWGFLFPPLSLVCLVIANKSMKTEKVNKFNKGAKIVSIIGIIFLITWVTLVSVVSLSDLGIPLF